MRLAYLLLLPCVLALVACVYLPPVWDIGDAINKIEDIEVGKTKRSEVLETLGEPQSGDTHARVFQYRGEESAGFLAYAVGGPGAVGADIVGKERWSVVVAFDQEDVVTSLSAESGYKADHLLPAECGYKPAQLILARVYRDGDPPNAMRAYFWYRIAEK